MLLRVTVVGHNVALPDPAAGDHVRSHRLAEALFTNDGILDTPTIDAACSPVERVCSTAQIIEGFAYQ